ncbi:MAG: ATP-binding protein, partial [Actinomycetes bacterium]
AIIKEKNITYPEGLVRVFVEVVSNAIDNTWRSLQENITPKFIKINIENNKISVWNDGKNIPLDIHQDEKIPIPELIFGNLLTSSNYNDDEERKTSGKNGYGVKLCNIFSSMFSVEVYNKEQGKIYTQVWRDNMYKKDPPTYKTKGFPKSVEDGKNGYTMVEFIPDFKRFGIEGLTEDVMSFYEKIIYDTAMTVSLKGVKVIYNGNIIPVSNIKDYVKLYFEEEPKNILTLASKDCKVVICPNNEFTHVSFVNGIYTKDGGIHVKKWSDAIFKPISEKINSSLKK